MKKIILAAALFGSVALQASILSKTIGLGFKGIAVYSLRQMAFQIQKEHNEWVQRGANAFFTALRAGAG